MTVEYVRTEDLPKVWPVVATMVSAALQHTRSEITLQDVEEALNARKAILYVAHQEGEISCAAVVEFVWYPRLVSAHVVALGGRRAGDHWGDFKQALRAAGVGQVEGHCHRAAARWCRRVLGWRSAYTVMVGDTA